MHLAMMAAAQRHDEFVATLRPSARCWANRRRWASAGVRPQIRQGCLATNLRWVLSQNHRGSANASRLLSTPLETDGSLGSAARGLFGKRVWPASEDDEGALISSLSPLSRAAIFAANASSTRRASAGTAQLFQQSLGKEPILILAAIAAVYILLGVLYESYIHPITMLSTLPSAGVGALLALMLFHTEFDIIGLLGLILLIGIVKKNAIMMVDFAVEAKRARELSSYDAIFEACMLRFRPIMMTTSAAHSRCGPTGAELRQRRRNSQTAGHRNHRRPTC